MSEQFGLGKGAIYFRYGSLITTGLTEQGLTEQGLTEFTGGDSDQRFAEKANQPDRSIPLPLVAFLHAKALHCSTIGPPIHQVIALAKSLVQRPWAGHFSVSKK